MSAPTPEQLGALLKVWETAQNDHGGSSVCAKLLLGLYNGSRFPFDLTELRRLDTSLMVAVLQVIEMDSVPQKEVHVHLGELLRARHMGYRFELMACRWRLKGRCNKAAEEDMRAALRGLGAEA